VNASLSPDRSAAPALAAIVTAMVSVQTGSAVAKGLFSQIGPEGVASLRVILAALILAVVFRPWRLRATRRAWPALVAYGVSLGLMNLTFYAALQRIPLGVAVAVEFAGPLGVAVLTSRLPLDFLWVGLAAAGIAALSPLAQDAHALDPVGLFLALGAGFFWGLYIVFGKTSGAEHGTGAAALGMAVAAVVAAPVALANVCSAMLEPRVLMGVVEVAILSSVLAYTLEMFALTRIPVRVFGTLMSLEPAIAALMGWLILRETLEARQCLAIGAIMVASLGVTLTARAERQPPAALTS
jgi:inner membrane transporter RhtA